MSGTLHRLRDGTAVWLRPIRPDDRDKIARGRRAPVVRPLFVRVTGEIEVTGTLKQRKFRYREDRFDPATVGDPLYFRDDPSAADVRLTPHLYREIASGGRRM